MSVRLAANTVTYRKAKDEWRPSGRPASGEVNLYARRPYVVVGSRPSRLS